MQDLHQHPLAMLAIACAGLSAIILVAYLVRKPPLRGATKVWLFFGLGVLPIGTAFGGNIEGYETTKKRTFCGSCHVMDRHAADSRDASSHSLAARHARNALFGDENCYACHADYGMYGTVTTKLGGLRHVWFYYTEYRTVPLEQALPTIHIRKPFQNQTCMHCHSTELDVWQRVPDHRASLGDVRAGRISCASGGCHGFAHPFTKAPAAAAEGKP